jgi:hypothetical protein
MIRPNIAALPLVVTRPRLVGLLLLLPVPLAFLGSLSSRLIVPGDALATASQVADSALLFRLGIASTLLLMVADACLVVLVFYQLLRPVNPIVAMLMMILNLLGVPITMLNELNLFAIPLLISAGSLPGEQMNASVSFWLSMHEAGSAIAGLFWGLWLIPYAVLVFRSGFLPGWFSILLVLECFGFLIQSFGILLTPDLKPNLGMLPAITWLVELFLPLWLIIKGIDVARWQQLDGADVQRQLGH